MTVVFDTNVFISAAVSRTGPSWQCFVLMARRRFQLAVTKEILSEYETTADRFFRQERKYQGVKWRPLFQWMHNRAEFFEPLALGKQRSRDADDDIFLACALAGGARIIVSKDNDLLDLEKPFGIEIMKPTIFAARFW
ncbi:MAG TPA: putative toxin-antitoxin system toxin component, PIN family [Candidatus Saccharimonadales bacterium]|nr:putative toxin-antitoxin system toxin component, PIN family [Candidatus Saccharimonadales bacterium]